MQRVVGNILIGLNALLVVFLLFGDRMQFPAWLQSVGRIHPLLLHIPIGAIVFAVIFLFLKKGTKWILAIGAVTAALTAIMGIILAGEGGYDIPSLLVHKYSGALLSFVLATAFFLKGKRVVVFSALILVLIAGHFGSVLTHGNDFVLEPLFHQTVAQKTVSDSTSLYAAAIQPIFDQKCNGCHNEKKAKGELVLSTLAGIAKGGEHGAVWLPGSPQASHLMKRILLPESHDDHMPPSGKAQLTAPEVQLLFQWILSGADTAKAWTRYQPSDTVRRLAEQFINKGGDASQQHYTFEAASPETIRKLNDPYRTVSPVALEEPALAATFFIRNEYRPSRLEELTAVKEQLVQLNLSKMPVTDADCETIRKFENLEKLNLNFSSVTSKGLKTLSSLRELRSLSLAGVKLDDGAKEALKEFKNLKDVYLFDTTAYVHEKLRLTPPIPVSDKTLLDKDEKMSLTHKLPGVVIRYTTDGTDPDSSKAKVFDKPIDINGYSIIKTRACKDGWLCSPVGTYVMYRKGVMPEETKLLTTPNKDYKGEGAATLTNNKKGFVDDHRDIAWIGFRDNPLSAEFKFPKGTNIRDITFSYDHNPDAWLFPPLKLQVWGGHDAEHLELLKELKPDQPAKNEERRNAAIIIPIDKNFEVYKIVAWPLPQLPKWHPANKPENKDIRAWLFVDEIIFGE